MHGRMKVRTTEEEQEIKKKERQKKLALFESARNRILEKRQNGQHDQEALELTAKMLLMNPDIVSFWNFRREIIASCPKSKDDETDYSGVVVDDAFFQQELQFTEGCLMENPKSYSAWQHRAWTLTQMQQPDCQRELDFCAKALEMDERNFHCWDYRRFVCNFANSPAENELQFSDHKISDNFSNYSAWHYRSSLLPKLFPDLKHEFVIEENKLKKELELVQNAFFTDPEDSSAWFYHYWLLQHQNKLSLSTRSDLCVMKLVLDLKTSRASVVLNSSANLPTWLTVVTVAADGVKLVLPARDFFTIDSARSSKCWTCPFAAIESITSTAFTDAVVTCELSYGSEIHQTVSSTRFADDAIVLLVGQSDSLNMSTNTASDGEFSEAIATLLTSEIQSCEQLRELEPANKWPLINLVVTMHALNYRLYQDKIEDYLAKLVSVDRKHKNYYEDLTAKFRIESRLNLFSQSSLWDAKQDAAFLSSLDLSGLKLSKLQLPMGLVEVLELNISNNSIASLEPLKYLCNLRVLKADNNRLASLQASWFPISLRCISLCDNCLSELEQFSPLKALPHLQELKAERNPLAASAIYQHVFGSQSNLSA